MFEMRIRNLTLNILK